jgi:hypothetical protein
VTDPFQDERRLHFGNSSACYITGNYYPILMKIGTQTEKTWRVQNIDQKYGKRKCRPIFKMAAAAILEIQVNAIKWAIVDQF